MTDSQSGSVAPLEPEGEPVEEGRRARRRQLLDAAKRLFLAKGFAQTSVSAIVREAGVAQGTFYLYFKGKQDLLPYLRGEVFDHYLRAAEESAADRDRPADARLVQALVRMQAIMREQIPMVRMLRDATSSEEVDLIWLDGRESLSRPLAAQIAAGCEDGSFAVDDVRMAAHLALALLDDLLFESLVWRRPAPPEQTLAHATRFLLRGLGSPQARIDELVPLPEENDR
jgi:AcrR family transcriptional regulator